MQLVYDPGPNRGPEPIHVGPPFGVSITPGVPFEAETEFAKALMNAIPGIHEHKVPEKGKPDREPSKGKRGRAK